MIMMMMTITHLKAALLVATRDNGSLLASAVAIFTL